MNIFVLSMNPQQAAEFHCDKHVVKMILETAQLLYCAHWVIDPSVLQEGAYKKTHPNHPCSLWVRESTANYTWLCDLGLWLCHEYTYRYGKIHKTQCHLEWLAVNTPAVPAIGPTPFRMAMPDHYKCADPVQAYQNYYIGDKQRMLNFTKRPPPPFLEKKTI